MYQNSTVYKGSHQVIVNIYVIKKELALMALPFFLMDFPETDTYLALLILFCIPILLTSVLDNRKREYLTCQDYFIDRPF